METSRNIAPIKLEMLFLVVHNKKLAYYSSIVQSHQANLQFTTAAKGTTHLILNYLGMSSERPKSLLISIVRADEAASLIDQLKDNFDKGEDYKGVAFTVKLTSVIGTLAYGFLSNEKKVVQQQEA
ncbi:MAG: hypothetical protein J6X99_01365 [Bacteroidales bacterium]|nr:hypothetical protein [Bacteroidales bacterium]